MTVCGLSSWAWQTSIAPSTLEEVDYWRDSTITQHLPRRRLVNKT